MGFPIERHLLKVIRKTLAIKGDSDEPINTPLIS
jgi:hypothetical protein